MLRLREARLVAIARDESRCVVCRAGAGLTVHHRIPRYVSHDDRPANLVTVCRTCHDTIEELDRIALYLSWAHVLGI